MESALQAARQAQASELVRCEAMEAKQEELLSALQAARREQASELVRSVAMQAKQEELVKTLAVARRIYEQERDRAGDLASRLASSGSHDG